MRGPQEWRAESLEGALSALAVRLGPPGDLPYLRHVVEAQYILFSALRERVATLAMNGKRDGGRWDYGVVSETKPENRRSSESWGKAMERAGLVLDHLGAERLKRVARGRAVGISLAPTGPLSDVDLGLIPERAPCPIPSPASMPP